MIYLNKNIFDSKYFGAIDTNELSSYLSDETHLLSWYGVSFQLDENEKIESKNLIHLFKKAFIDIIDSDKIGDWVIQPFQPIKTYPWFDNLNSNKEFKKLTSFIGSSFLEFKGYIQLNQFQIKDMFDELFYFSLKTNSQDLIILNPIKPFIIILGQHLTIDIVSSEKTIVDEFIFKLSKYDFLVKKYS